MSLGIPAPRTEPVPVVARAAPGVVHGVVRAPRTEVAPSSEVPEVAPPSEMLRSARRDVPRQPTGRPWVVSALAVALALAVVVAGYLWVVADAWRDRAQQLTADRTTTSASTASLQRQVDQLQTLLDASDARVEQLAAEKARLVDVQEARSRSGRSSASSTTSTGAAASSAPTASAAPPTPERSAAAAPETGASAGATTAPAGESG